jgi:RimJ/RimL family protein N-acetyltransferase
MLTTQRLKLRHWHEADLEPLAAMTSDPAVMRYFGVTRDRAQSDAWAARVCAHIERHGFGILAVEAPGVAPFIGFVGLSTVASDFPMAPAVEIVWTLAATYWRRGYATEAARAALDDGFSRLRFAEIVAFTAVINAPSRAVMERLGMCHDAAGDFDNPRVPAGHELCRHVLYRIRADGGNNSGL